MGTVYLKMGKTKHAEHHFRQAAEINPTNAILLCCIGAVVEEQGDLQEALRYYEQACRCAPDSAMVAFKRVRVLVALNDIEVGVQLPSSRDHVRRRSEDDEVLAEERSLMLMLFRPPYPSWSRFLGRHRMKRRYSSSLGNATCGPNAAPRLSSRSRMHASCSRSSRLLLERLSWLTGKSWIRRRTSDCLNVAAPICHSLGCSSRSSQGCSRQLSDGLRCAAVRLICACFSAAHLRACSVSVAMHGRKYFYNWGITTSNT